MTPPETTVGDFGTPEQETGRFSGDRNLYWESNMTIGSNGPGSPTIVSRASRSASICW